MSETHAPGPNVPTLHEIVDAEVGQARASQDPSMPLDPELQEYLLRLQGLREAVVAMEEYEESLGDF